MNFLRPILLATLLTAPLCASSFSFHGTFAADDQVQLFGFDVASTSTVTIRSLGYGGGTDSNASVVQPGGFDTLFSVFEGNGTQIGAFDDDPGCAHSNYYNEACLDSYFSNVLPAGSYILALTVSGNNPNGDLSDGFGEQGNGNFTCLKGFCDLFGNQNTGNWAITFSAVTSVSDVPEPANLLVAATGLILFSLLYLARRNSRTYRSQL